MDQKVTIGDLQLESGDGRYPNQYPNKFQCHSINCVLLNVNSKSFTRPLAQLYFTDFQHNSLISPQGSSDFEFSLGNEILVHHQVLAGQMQFRKYKALCADQLRYFMSFGTKEYDSTRDVERDPSHEGTLKRLSQDRDNFFNYQSMAYNYHFGLFCNIVISNLKSYQGVLECDIESLTVIGDRCYGWTPTTEQQLVNKYGSSIIEVMRYYLALAGKKYLKENQRYLKKAVPTTLLPSWLQPPVSIAEESHSMMDIELDKVYNSGGNNTANGTTIKPLKKDTLRKLDELEKDDCGSDNESDILEISEDEINRSLVTGSQEFQDFATIAPGDIQQIKNDPDSLEENKEYIIRGKIVDFNHDSEVIAYKDSITDIPKLKTVKILITDAFNGDECDKEDLVQFEICDSNTLELELDAIEDILEFFEVTEIEELYVKQSELVKKVDSLIERSFSAAHLHQKIEFKVYKKPHKSLGYSWGVRGLKMGLLG
ncbi:hypothetical protein DASC09_023220 [Saccharomycopsis crataegensis]|uniref:Uncharacterized protein n=1 Tax=Saccharomycopsis crataegensis TaxID=43959 RepID=A0AAV5QK50_9ASCO|nr:hypothetical protein DASC09_023220 [Saccharomycopsis crataegensis]